MPKTVVLLFSSSSYHFKLIILKTPVYQHSMLENSSHNICWWPTMLGCFVLFCFSTGKPLITFLLKKFMSQKQKGTQGIRTIRGIKLLSLYKNSILWFGLQHVGRHMSLHSLFYMYLSCLRVCDKYPCLTTPCQNTLSNLLPFQLWLFCHNIQIMSLHNLLSIQL